MTADPCARHATREATHVAMVRTTTGRSVFRLCAECAEQYPNASQISQRVDQPRRAR